MTSQFSILNQCQCIHTCKLVMSCMLINHFCIILCPRLHAVNSNNAGTTEINHGLAAGLSVGALVIFSMVICAILLVVRYKGKVTNTSPAPIVPERLNTQWQPSPRDTSLDALANSKMKHPKPSCPTNANQGFPPDYYVITSTGIDNPPAYNFIMPSIIVSPVAQGLPPTTYCHSPASPSEFPAPAGP